MRHTGRRLHDLGPLDSFVPRKAAAAAADKGYLPQAFRLFPAPVLQVRCYYNRRQPASWHSSSEGEEHWDHVVHRMLASAASVDMHSGCLGGMHTDSEEEAEDDLGIGRSHMDTATWPMLLLSDDRAWGILP